MHFGYTRERTKNASLNAVARRNVWKGSPFRGVTSGEWEAE